MRIELIILAITLFFIYNTYYEGKFTKILMSYKKYYQMAFFALMGIGIYIMIKRDPTQCKNILMNANNVVKYMPFDRSSMDMINPLLDFTTTGSGHFMEGFDNESLQPTSYENIRGEKLMMKSGKGGTKRSVSETKKKYVASLQNWKCGKCEQQLNHTFEIDHKIRLEYGGGNDVDNLIALCRNCHGTKTAMENM